MHGGPDLLEQLQGRVGRPAGKGQQPHVAAGGRVGVCGAGLTHLLQPGADLLDLGLRAADVQSPRGGIGVDLERGALSTAKQLGDREHRQLRVHCAELEHLHAYCLAPQLLQGRPDRGQIFRPGQGDQVGGLLIDRQPCAVRARQERLYHLQHRFRIGRGDGVDLQLQCGLDPVGLQVLHTRCLEGLQDLGHLLQLALLAEHDQPHAHRIQGEAYRAIGGGVLVGRDAEHLPQNGKHVLGQGKIEREPPQLLGAEPFGILDPLKRITDGPQSAGGPRDHDLLGLGQHDD